MRDSSEPKHTMEVARLLGACREQSSWSVSFEGGGGIRGR